MPPIENPVFVVGVFRSGTSLLCSLLNQNPKVALMYECDVWNFPPALLEYRFRHNWVERIEFYNQALSRHRMIDLNDNQALENIRMPHDLYRAFGEKKGATVTGEKSPFYCNRLEQLHKRYPGALFIFVWRHPVEVYRSVLKAGQTSRFFGRPGMLSRLIYQKEEAIRQTERIQNNGARIYRVDYAALVDEPEKVLREICAFIGVAFDPQMLQLGKADLSAIYNVPHHNHLRRGVIGRQTYAEDLVPSRVAGKLERYRRRWEILQTDWLKPKAGTTESRPGKLEYFFDLAVGRVLICYDSIVRAGFEFLPLPWLRIYRLLKSWLANPPSKTIGKKSSMTKDLKQHWLTIFVAIGLVTSISFIHGHADPHLQFNLFYAVPCGLTALVVSVRWASIFVVACAITSAIIQYKGDSDYRPTAVFVWNFLTNSFLLELFVLTIGRIRLEFSNEAYKVN